jgi:hypothetical protein
MCPSIQDRGKAYQFAPEYSLTLGAARRASNGEATAIVAAARKTVIAVIEYMIASEQQVLSSVWDSGSK